MIVGNLFVISLVLATAPLEQPVTLCADLRPAMDAIAGALESRYVLPSRGTEGAARLRVMSRRGDVTRVCGDGPAKAKALTRATRDALNDLHLRVAFGPPDPSDPPLQPDGYALADNLGIEEVSRMPGGIGYLRITGWAPLSWVEPRLANAFALLRDSTAIIIDVRGNPGGDGGTVNLVTRTFLPVGASPTLLSFDRAGKPAKAVTSKEPTWPRFPQSMPLVVLIDRESGSGSEALAYSLREEQRATIIGSRSAGAAHSVRDAVALPGGFALYIPQYRLEGRISHTDWEGIGVRPDVEAGTTDAKMLAWEFLRQKLGAAQK
ncbi:MAG: S41 family peptidase [Sphingomicrobium sp.]